MKATEEKNNIRIRNPVIRRSGSVSKRHGYETLAGSFLKNAEKRLPTDGQPN